MSFFDPFGVGGMIDNFMHPERGYEAAERASREGYNEAQGYMNPYNQYGRDQYGRLMDAQGKLMDPAALEAEWAKKYETSPYAKRMLGMNTQQGLEAASSMGLMGSSGALQNIQQGAGDIVARDRQQYMNDLMQKYMSGIGIGQNIYGIGANTANNQANLAFQQGNNQAGLEYGRTNAPGQLFGNLAGMGANIAANYFMPGTGTISGGFNQGTYR
jgi:hypothetical protein